MRALVFLIVAVFSIVCYASIGAGIHWLVKGDAFNFETASTWFYLFGWPTIPVLVMFAVAAVVLIIAFIGMAFENFRT